MSDDSTTRDGTLASPAVIARAQEQLFAAGKSGRQKYEELVVGRRRAERRKAFVHRLEPLLGEIGDRDRISAGRLVEVADQVRTPVARADDPDADGVRQRRGPRTGRSRSLRASTCPTASLRR